MRDKLPLNTHDCVQENSYHTMTVELQFFDEKKCSKAFLSRDFVQVHECPVIDLTVVKMAHDSTSRAVPAARSDVVM